MIRFYAWAIDTNSSEGHGLIGRYYFNHQIPVSLEGCKIALYKTRAEVRRDLKIMKDSSYIPFQKAKVIQVEVTVKEYLRSENNHAILSN